MTIIDVNPNFYFFSNYHKIYFPDDFEKRRVFCLLHSSSVKLAQLDFFHSQIPKIKQDYISKDYLTDEDHIKISAVVEAMITNSKSAIDLGINGLLTLKDPNNKIDSINKLISNIKKGKSSKAIQLEEYLKLTIKELETNEFSWLRLILSRGTQGMSLRDKLIHKQYLEFYSAVDSNSNTVIYINTKEFTYDQNEDVVPVYQLMSLFCNELVIGTKSILDKIRVNIQKHNG